MKKMFFSSYVLLGLIGLVLVACSDEKIVKAPAKVVDNNIIVPTNASATVLALSTQINNGGKVGTLTVTGNGAMEQSTVDPATGEENVQPYTILSDGSATVTLDKDTIEVEKFGVECIGYPETSTEDISSDEKSGQKTTMATWKYSDGQTSTGLMAWAYTKAQTSTALPHLVVENLRFNKVVSVEVLSERFAEVTLSFLVDVKGVNSKTTTGAGEQEIRVSYIQALPEPEPKGPTYDYSLTFSLKNEQLKGTFTVTGDNGFTATYPWTAAKVAKYQGQERLNVASTEAALHEQNVADYPAENSTKTNERDGLEWTAEKICKEIFQNRGWMSNGGGILPHPEKVYFYTTSVSVTLPDGRKVTAKIEQNTVFRDDVYAKNSSLIGDVYQLPNEDITYTYNTTCTIVSDHYVTCTVVEDGEERPFDIACLVACLEGGLLLHNTGDINLYTK